MPRGEEIQEVPHEGREESKEVQESKPEAKRDAEVIAKPEVVIERERPVEESEQIEGELKAAMEAVPSETVPEVSSEILEATAALDIEGEGSTVIEAAPSAELDGKGEGRVAVTEASAELDGKGERGSAGEAENNPTPLPSPVQENPAPNWEEEPPRPPQGTMGDGGEETEDREGQPQLGEQVLNEEELQTIRTDGQVMQSEEEEEEEEGEQTRPREEVMEEEELQTIRTNGQIMQSEEEEEEEEGEQTRPREEVMAVDEELQSIRADGQIVDEVDEMLIDDASLIIEKPESEVGESGTAEKTEEGTDEGGSILIGQEKEELQEIDLTGEASKEVEEYWEPPEMYAIHKTDGTIILVDKHGNSIESPPHVQKSNTGNAEAWYPGAKSGEIFQVPIYHWPSAAAANMYAYYEEDGSVSIVDQDGNLISNPPHNHQYQGKTLVNVYDDGFGQAIELSTYVPSTKGIYAYKAPDGSIDIVDKEGNLIKCPPHFYQDGLDPNIYLKMEGEQPIIIPEYDPPLDGIYLYQSQDGSYSIVDKNGKPVKSPPHLALDGTSTPHIKGNENQVIEIKVYQPPMTDVYAYTSQDGTVYLVDKDGNQVDSPPHLDVEHNSPLGTKFHTPDGSDSGIEIPPYQPPIKDIYVHLNQDGSIDIVDKNGKMIKSPPNITFDYDHTGKPIYMAKHDGMPLESSVQLKYYKPTSSHWDKKLQ